MNSIAISYLQLNALLLVSYCLWYSINRISAACSRPQPYKLQLSLARYAFSAVIAVSISAWLFEEARHWFSALSLPGSDTVVKLDEYLKTTTGLSIYLVENSIPQSKSSAGLGLLTIILIAFIAQLTYLAYQFILLRRIIGQATIWRCFKKFDIYFSDQITTPFSTFIFLRRQIVLPYSLLDSAGNLPVVIKHELQHIRNGDLQWTLLLELVKLFCPWNPAIYLWKREFDSLQEYSCDEALITHKKVCDTLYKNCLLDVATSGTSHRFATCSNMVPGFSFLHSKSSQLNRRFKMMESNKNRRTSAFKLTVQAMSFSVALLFSSIAIFAQQSLDINVGNASDAQSVSSRIDKAVQLGRYGAFTSSINILEPIYSQFQNGELDDRDSHALLMAYFGLYHQREEFTKAADYLDMVLSADFAHLDEQTLDVLRTIKERTLASADKKPLSTLHTESAEYPEVGVEENASGWVLVEFGIDEDGLVTDPVVQDNCLSRLGAETDCNAESTQAFLDSSIEAIQKFTFNPYHENGVTSSYDGIKYLFRFDLPESAQN